MKIPFNILVFSLFAGLAFGCTIYFELSGKALQRLKNESVDVVRSPERINGPRASGSILNSPNSTGAVSSPARSFDDVNRKLRNQSASRNSRLFEDRSRANQKRSNWSGVQGPASNTFDASLGRDPQTRDSATHRAHWLDGIGSSKAITQESPRQVEESNVPGTVGELQPFVDSPSSQSIFNRYVEPTDRLDSWLEFSEPVYSNPAFQEAPSFEHSSNEASPSIEGGQVDEAPLELTPAELAPAELAPSELAPAELAPLQSSPHDEAPVESLPTPFESEQSNIMLDEFYYSPIQQGVDVDLASSPAFPKSPSGFVNLQTVAFALSQDFSDNLGFDPFDYELGIRLNAQNMIAGAGHSLTYVGINEWTGNVTSDSGSLGIFNASGNLVPFQNAIFQQKIQEASWHGIEWNKVTWAWDVLHVYWGIRAIRYEENFDFFSSRADGQQGLLNMGFENYMIGPQIGAEILNDSGHLFSSGFKFKLGANANILNRDTILIANGNRLFDNSSNDVKLNFYSEFGVFGRMRVGRNAFLRTGLELWYNNSVFQAQQNVPGIVDASFGESSVDSSLLIHGGSLGFEMYW